LETKALKHKNNKYPPAHSISFDHNSLNRDELILKYAPLIKYIAHRLAMRLPPHISTEVLVSAGVIGLMDALNKYDPSKNVQFKTYAEFRIRGAMLDELRSLDWVPRSIRQKAAQLEKTFLTLERKRGGPVEDDEVAKELGLTLEEYYNLITEIKGISLLDLEGLRYQIPQFVEENFLTLLIDEKENDPFHLLSLEELKKILARAIDELSPKEKTVISLYYYEEMTLKEIGAVLGFTESRICQIHTKAILKLRGKIKSYLYEEPELACRPEKKPVNREKLKEHARSKNS
jgi:RNA polymerase sigma factor for flagellar operon FliA